MAVLRDHLIAHYKMNDNTTDAEVVDATGNHHGEYQINGVAQNTNTGDSTGKILGALDFVTADKEHIEIDDADDFSPGDGSTGTPFSISAWINMHDAESFTIASKGVYNTNGEWLFYISNIGQLSLLFYDETVDNCYIQRRDNIDLRTAHENIWLHVVGTYDGGTIFGGLSTYRNGIKVGDAGNNSGAFVAVENLNGAVWIGKSDTSFADGLIDNVMIFNKELTLLEIRYLYNNGAGVESIPTLVELSRTGHRFSSFPEN